MNRLQKEYGLYVKHNIFKSLTLMDHSNINSKKKGDYITSLTKDIDAVYENYILCSVQLLVSLVTAVVYLIYIYDKYELIFIRSYYLCFFCWIFYS